MKATELRIENLTLAKSPEKTEWIEGHPISIFDLNYLMYPKSKGAIPIDLKPIPLTEEWLVRFGFDDTNDSDISVYCIGVNWSEQDGDYNDAICISRGVGDWYVSLGRKVDVKYVHELQNIFYSIFGQELELKK